MPKKSRSKENAKKVVLRTVSFGTKEQVELHKIAHFAFFAGLMLAILAGLFQNVFISLLGDSLAATQIIVTTLATLGLFVGLFNLTAQETQPFLIATVALMLAGIVNFSLIPAIGITIRNILSNIVIFVVPGAIILAMKTIWKLALD